MKSLKTLLVLFLAAALGLGFVCCGPDDPVPASVPNPTPTPDPTPNPTNNTDPTDNTDEVTGNNRGPVAQSFRGNGTQNDPYIISDATELRKLSDDCAKGMTYRGEYFKMTADVTINRNVLRSDGELNGDGNKLERWIPIGLDQEHPFCGTFDGNGHTISGLYIVKNKDAKASGLFSWLAGTVQSLTIKDSYIEGYACAGSICGRTMPYSGYKASVKNCINYSHIISGGWGAGGIVGDNDCYDNVVDRCLNYGKIDGEAMYCSGIVGRSIRNVSITNSVNYGRISNCNAAGIVASMGVVVDVLNCANFGEVYDTSENSTDHASCGICMNTSKAMNNCVNYGIVHFHDGLGYGLFNEPLNSYNNLSSKQKNYYLETSCSKGFEYGGSASCKSMTSKEMQQQSFLDELNKNAKALGSSYSQWKFGKNGYPTLDFVKE